MRSEWTPLALGKFLERATTGGGNGAFTRSGAPDTSGGRDTINSNGGDNGNDTVTAATVATAAGDAANDDMSKTTMTAQEDTEEMIAHNRSANEDSIASCGAGSAAASALQHAAHDLIVSDKGRMNVFHSHSRTPR